MAIKDWHGGQLVIAWIGVGMGWFAFGFILFNTIGDEFYGLHHERIDILIWASLFPVVVALLVITWMWFGGRAKS